MSKQQARLIALCVAKDIRAYIDDHPKEFKRFIEDYRCTSDVTAPLHPANESEMNQNYNK